LRSAEREFQGIDPEGMVPRIPFLHFMTAGVQGELAEQQCGVVSVGEAAFVAQTGHAGVGERAVHHAQQVAHLGDGWLVLNQLTGRQPVL
jgi:hypothetical protein